jgi:hypothetical protein
MPTMVLKCPVFSGRARKSSTYVWRIATPGYRPDAPREFTMAGIIRFDADDFFGDFRHAQGEIPGTRADLENPTAQEGADQVELPAQIIDGQRHLPQIVLVERLACDALAMIIWRRMLHSHSFPGRPENRYPANKRPGPQSREKQPSPPPGGCGRSHRGRS